MYGRILPFDTLTHEPTARQSTPIKPTGDRPLCHSVPPNNHIVAVQLHSISPISLQARGTPQPSQPWNQHSNDGGCTTTTTSSTAHQDQPVSQPHHTLITPRLLVDRRLPCIVDITSYAMQPHRLLVTWGDRLACHEMGSCYVRCFASSSFSMHTNRFLCLNPTCVTVPDAVAPSLEQ
jgi:hypothetical protein